MIVTITTHFLELCSVGPQFILVMIFSMKFILTTFKKLRIPSPYLGLFRPMYLSPSGRLHNLLIYYVYAVYPNNCISCTKTEVCISGDTVETSQEGLTHVSEAWECIRKHSVMLKGALINSGKLRHLLCAMNPNPKWKFKLSSSNAH